MSNTSDHFIPATYLDQFAILSGKKKRRVYVYLKRTGRCDPRLTGDICKRRRGDLNKFFTDPTILKQWLPVIERDWKRTIEEVHTGRDNGDTYFRIAGMMAYIMSCSPTVTRMMKEAFEHQLNAARPYFAKQATADISDPEERKLTVEGLLSPHLKVTVDEEFPRALSIKGLVELQCRLFQGDWMLLHAKEPGQFVTGDYPVQQMNPDLNVGAGLMYFPLTSRYALFVEVPPRNPKEEFRPDMVRTIQMGRLDRRMATPEGLSDLNLITAQGADDVIVSSSNEPWFLQLGSASQAWGMRCFFDKIPIADGFYGVVRIRRAQRAEL